MSNPQISIIVPVYNVEQYLRRCLDSILAQTFTEWECILVDDGSTDGSGKICDEYVNRDGRFKVIHKENGGVSSARNRGIEEAIGEWLYFADSDDTVDAQALEVLVEGSKQTRNLVIAGYRKFSDDGILIEACYRRNNKLIDIEEAIKELYHPSDYSFRGYLWDKLYLSAIVKRNKLRFCEDVYFNEDQLFTLQYLCQTKGTVFYTTTPVYNYHERSSSAMSSLRSGYNPRFATQFDAYVMMKDMVFGYTKDKDIRRFALEAIAGSYTYNHQLMLSNKKIEHAIHRKMFCGMLKTGAYKRILITAIKSILLLFCPSVFLLKK